MRKSQQILSLFLLVTFVMSINGIMVYTNTCPMSGEVNKQYLLNNCCCSGEEGNGCCDTTIDHVSYLPDGVSNIDHIEFSVPAVIKEVEGYVFVNYNPLLFSEEKQEPVNYIPPNRLGGKQLLIEIETFLI